MRFLFDPRFKMIEQPGFAVRTATNARQCVAACGGSCDCRTSLTSGSRVGAGLPRDKTDRKTVGSYRGVKPLLHADKVHGKKTASAHVEQVLRMPRDHRSRAKRAPLGIAATAAQPRANALYPKSSVYRHSAS